MTSSNYLPGITNFRVYNHEFQDETLVVFSPGVRTEILVEFTLTGFNLLKGPFDDEMRDFFINVFLIKQQGGFGDEVVSSSSFHCDIDLKDNEFATFISSVNLSSEEQDIGDFVNTFYYIDVVYSSYEPNDGSDLYFILNSVENRLLRTKLAFSLGDNDE